LGAQLDVKKKELAEFQEKFKIRVKNNGVRARLRARARAAAQPTADRRCACG
jgi:hypothetical protein